ncbi:carbon monoxide dehydrogenase [Nakamurella silvestris]|nr:carbon monoxide dehydrogenase [Nakamurella silvestris]
MELEHRFTLPVGIDKAWPALLDWELVSTCFPGTTLDSANGNDFSGSSTIKLGPLPLTYHGKATVVERDDRAHRAVIEATGNATRSASNAAMLVTATATATAPNKTTVDLVTTLSITGRPAKFGRPIMVEVGNKLISEFANAIAEKLAGKPAGGFALVESSNPDEVAAALEAEAVLEAEVAAAPAVAPAVSAPRHAAPDHTPRRVPTNQPVDVLGPAAAPAAKQYGPIIAGIVVAILVIRKLRK